MPEFTVEWTCTVHGSCTVEAEDEQDARELVMDTAEGVELENIAELYPAEVEVTRVEFFQD